MKLIKTTVLSGVTTLAKLSSGFISLKIVAVIIGPSGVALVGQLMNFITMAGTVASGATNGGVTSFTAKYHDDEQQKYKVWHTAVWLSGEGDDYSGSFLTNPAVSVEYCNVDSRPVHLGKHAIIGAGAVVLPCAKLNIGVASGSLSLVLGKDYPEFMMHAGTPAKAIKERKRALITLEKRINSN